LQTRAKQAVKGGGLVGSGTRRYSKGRRCIAMAMRARSIQRAATPVPTPGSEGECCQAEAGTGGRTGQAKAFTAGKAASGVQPTAPA